MAHEASYVKLSSLALDYDGARALEGRARVERDPTAVAAIASTIRGRHDFGREDAANYMS